MKKLLLAAVAASVFSLTLASPALADEYAKNCKTILGPDGSAMGIGCAALETHDWQPAKLRGVGYVQNVDPNTSVQYQFIAAYENGNLKAGDDDLTPWWGTNTPYHTPYFNCFQLPTYHSKVKVRMKRDNGRTSDWYIIRSDDLRGINWCAP